MTKNFSNQLQDYITGSGAECQHPINQVDDENVCHLCGIDVMERKHIKEFDPQTMQLASQNDIRRMWLRLWGDVECGYVAGLTLSYYRFGNEPLDETQLSNSQLYELVDEGKE